MASNTVDDAVELEAMRREDSSWHPCKVSLSSSGVGLIIDFESSGLEDIIVNEEEAFSRLRVRSIPLQGDVCSLIQEGEHVLAAQKLQSKILFFDAKVEKALKVRHSKKVHCRCTFMINWLHHNPNAGTLTVPSNSIMKLATKSIKSHPTISTFLITLKTFSCSDVPASPTLLVDIDSEMDLNELLKKQIEEISNFADISQKKILPEILLEIQADNRGLYQCKPHTQVPPNENQSKRSTRGRNKLEMEMEVKDPPQPSPSIQEALSEIRSPLNPLAARAALASLMSNLPQDLESSLNHEDKKGCTNSSDNINPKHIVVESLDGTKSHNCHTGNTFLMSEKVSSDSEDAPVLSMANKVVNSLISTIEMSFGAFPKGSENENRASEITGFSTSFSCLGERKSRQPTKSNRLTRLATKQGAASCDHDIERNTSVEEMKVQSSTNMRRSTRSTAHKENKTHTIKDEQRVETYKSTKYSESDSTCINNGVLESHVSKDKKSTFSPFDAEIESPHAEKRNSPAETKEGKGCAKDTKLRNSTNVRRATRSAIREEKENGTLEAGQGLEEDKLAQHDKSNSSEEVITVPEIVVVTAEELNSSSLDAEVDLIPTEGRSKKWHMSSSTKTTKKTEGNIWDNSESSQGQKRKSTSLKKQELRFSPRLKFLPRTRSQNKS